MERLQLTWHGHSCFQLDTQAYTMVFDPYQDGSVPGLGPLRLSADLVLCSHDHHDHNAASLVTPITGRENPFRISVVETDHDSEGGMLRGKNLIHIVEGCGFRIAHFGDIGAPLTPLQKAEIGPLDLALIPVGGFYTINAQEAKALLDGLNPRITVAMHYRTETAGYPVLAPLSEFLSLATDYVYYPTNTLAINPFTKPQIAVLTLPE